VLIVDTGPLVAAADRADPHHHSCAELLETAVGPLITTPLVIAEAVFLITRQLGAGAEAAFYDAIITGDLIVDTLTRGDWVRVQELVDRYANLPLGGTDASVIAIAERHRAVEVATIDHRHFHIVRPNHTPRSRSCPDRHPRQWRRLQSSPP
jgi:uncharacterized protein